MSDIFENGTRLKVRFPYNGVATIEDLWGIRDLSSLNAVYVALVNELKAQTEVGLIKSKTSAVEMLELQIAIVQHIYDTKIAERDAADAEKRKKAQREFLLELYEKKKNEKYENMSADELLALIQS